MRFDEIPEEVRGQAGLYEIRHGRLLLKVGIASDLYRRLKQHKDSKQKCLKGPRIEPWSDPSGVVSKASILAKHLYFDRSIARNLDLCTEWGRRTFLGTCRVRLACMPVLEARRHERLLEHSKTYRYCGIVKIR